jgi:hypothetical protein
MARPRTDRREWDDLDRALRAAQRASARPAAPPGAGGEAPAAVKEVDRAVAAVARQATKLPAILGRGDARVAARAAALLAGLGPLAVGPLARALPRACSTAHALAIVSALEAAGRDGGGAHRPLLAAVRRTKDPVVQAWARAALARAIAGPKLSGPMPPAAGPAAEAYWLGRLADIRSATPGNAMLVADADLRRARARGGAGRGQGAGTPEVAPSADPAAERELARSVESIDKAVGRLIGLLDNRDEGVVAAAVFALVKVGPAAVARLGAALRTAPEPRHRGLMVVVLGQIAGRDPSGVSSALEAEIAAERYPAVLAMARAVRDAVASA